MQQTTLSQFVTKNLEKRRARQFQMYQMAGAFTSNDNVRFKPVGGKPTDGH